MAEARPHPQCISAVESFRAANPPATSELTPQSMRAFAESLFAGGEAAPLPAGVTRREIGIDVGERTLRCVAFSPPASDPLPIVVHLHGGGWVYGSIEAEAFLSGRIAAGADCVVLSVDYRLAPENPFPAAVDDAYAALERCARHAPELGGDPDRIGVFGGSAGANVVAGAVLMAAERNGPRVVCQALMVPALQHYAATTSRRDYDGGYDFMPGWLDWYSDQYLGDRHRAQEPLAAPLHAADVRGLPPAFIGVAEFDPVRDDGVAYAEKLQDAGVPVRFEAYDGMIHSFLALAGIVERADAAIDDVCTYLRDRLGAA